jgi:hypothetical protein
VHRHGTILFDGGGQFSTRLLPLSCAGIESTEAKVTVRLERAHAKILGQGECLLVVGSGWLSLRGVVMRSNITEQPQDPRLVTTFFALTGEFKGLPGELARLCQTARKQIGFAQVGD